MTTKIEDRIRQGRWLDLLNNPKQVESICNTEYELSLFKLKIVGEVHIFFSMMHLSTLKAMSLSNAMKGPTTRYEALNEGSHYLENAYKLVKTYADCNIDEIKDKNIEIVEAIIRTLGFDPRHIDYGRNNKWFIVEKQDSLYYQLLHSETNKGVRLFLKIVEQNIDASIKLFLKSIGSKLQIICLEDLFESIKYNNYTAVQKCIKKASILEGNVDFKNVEGISPLHFAIRKGHLEIVNLLLESGSDVTHVTDDGLTPLHVAVTKKHGIIVDTLLEYVSSEQLNNFVNLQIRGGITALHMAAKNGSLIIVRSLLSHGAAYNVKDKEGKTPLEYSKDVNVSELLKLIDKMFNEANNFNERIIDKLKAVKSDECVAVLNATDFQNCKTMFQIYMGSEQDRPFQEFIRSLTLSV